MQTHTPSKKPAPQDWHNADIKAALEKAGWSLRRLGKTHGFAPGSITKVMQTQWPNAERIIAAALGIAPHRIWPSRYESDGRPKRKRLDIPLERNKGGAPLKGSFGGKHSSGPRAVNVNRGASE